MEKAGVGVGERRKCVVQESKRINGLRSVV